MEKSAQVVRAMALMATVSTMTMTAAVAQTVPAPPGKDAPSQPALAAPGGGLEDIVVTARKRAETVQDIPVAVTAFSPTQIQRNDISSIERIAAVTPNLTVGRTPFGSGAQIALRGIGTPATAMGVESSTAIIVDGIYYSNGRILNEGFFDLSSIQVLKGPQALFFGKNATAGVISIDTANPGDRFEASTRLGYEIKAQQPYIEQIISTPLTDRLGVRLAVHASKMFGGYARNRASTVTYTVADVTNPAVPIQTVTTSPPASRSPREKEIVGRLTLRWEPMDNLTSTLKVSGSIDRTNDPLSNNFVYSCASGFSTLQPGTPCQRSWVFYHNPMPVEIAANFPHAKKDGSLYSDYRSFSVSNNAELRLGDITLTSNANFQYQRSEYLAANNNWQRIIQIYTGSLERWHNFSEELRATTNYDGMLNGMVGVLYQKSWVFADQNTYVGNLKTSSAIPSYQYLASNKRSTSVGQTFSPFAQVIFKPIRQIEIAGGGRYTHEIKDSDFIHPFVRAGQIFRLLTPIVAKQRFNNFSPEATISYKPNSNVNIYVGYKTGYKSGGFSNESSYTTFSAPGDLDFEPEKAKGVEGGIKITTLERQLRLALAAFSYKYTDLQIDFFEAQSFRYLTTNAGSARTRGVELNFDYAPRAIPNLNMHGALNYVRAKYLDYIAPCTTGQTPAGGCQITAASPYGGLFVQDLSGKPTANAPKWTGAVGGSYEVELGGDRRLALSADARYSGRYNASAFANPLAYQPKYVNIDASLFLRSGDRWEAAVIGKNLTNRFVISGSVDAASTGSGTGTAGGILSDQRGYANNPRTVQLQFTYHY